jgi:hypothetical protein
MQYFLGGTSVLIVVGVALELVDKLNAQLVMKAYEGGTAPSPKGGGGGASWTRPSGGAGSGAAGGTGSGKGATS